MEPDKQKATSRPPFCFGPPCPDLPLRRRQPQRDYALHPRGVGLLHINLVLLDRPSHILPPSSSLPPPAPRWWRGRRSSCRLRNACAGWHGCRCGRNHRNSWDQLMLRRWASSCSAGPKACSAVICLSNSCRRCIESCIGVCTATSVRMCAWRWAGSSRRP